MRPLCCYGFPCAHKVYSDDPFCVHPMTADAWLKKYEDDPTIENELCGGILSDWIWMDCPLLEELRILRHIEPIIEKICERCNGTGNVILDYSFEDRKVKSRAPCPDCTGDGVI